MPEQSQQPKGASKARRPAPAWLRLATVCVVLIVVPVALYLFLYQRSRIEDATIRNFRALDTAANRVDEVLQRLSSVVNGSSFGMSPAMLGEVTERLTGRKTACGPDGGADAGDWRKPALPGDLLASRETTDAQRLQYRYWLAAHILYESDKEDRGATRRLWDHLHCLIDTHRHHSRPNEPIEVEVGASPRLSLRPTGGRCAEIVSDAACRRLRDLLRRSGARNRCPPHG